MYFFAAKLNERIGVREQIEGNLENLNVIVTTYTLAKQKEDNKFLRRLKPVVCAVINYWFQIWWIYAYPLRNRSACTMKVTS